MISMNTQIDIYCERMAPGLLAEPLNAVTNLAFFVAAYLAYRLARAENTLDVPATVLITLVAIIGTGSALFHTFATNWAKLSDTLPILFYQIAFLGFYASRVAKFKAPVVTGLLLLFFAMTYGFGHLPGDVMNGSLSYAPAFIFLAGFSLWHYVHAEKENKALMIAAGVFLLSLTFRTLDMALCEDFTIGTHFLWHILNGVVLYLTTRSYILNAPALTKS